MKLTELLSKNVQLAKISFINHKQVDKCPLMLLIFLLFYSLNSSAQIDKKIDSLEQIIKETKIDTALARQHLTLAEKVVYTDPKKTKYHLNIADSIYKKNPDQRGLANFYAVKATYLYTQSELDSSTAYLNKAGDQYLKIGDTLAAIKMKSNIAIVIQVSSGDYDKIEEVIDEIEPIVLQFKDTSMMASISESRSNIAESRGYRNIALEKMGTSLKLREAIGDSLYLPQTYYHIGGLYGDVWEYEKAINSFKKGIEIADAIGSNNLKAQLLKLMGMNEVEMKRYDAAALHLSQALALSRTINFKVNEQSSLIQLGRLEVLRNNINKSREYFNQAEQLGELSAANRYNFHLSRGEFNYQTDNLNTALKDYEICIAHAEKQNSWKNISWSKLGMSKVLQKMGNSDKAYRMLMESSDAKDSLNSYYRTSLAEEQEVIFETEKRERELIKKENEIILLEERQKASFLRNTLLTIGLISILVIFSLLYYALRQKNKRTKVEKDQLDQELLFKHKELTSHALHLAKKNEVLESIKQKAKDLKLQNSSNGYQQLIQTINFDLKDDNNWDNFKKYFEAVHKDFNGNVKKKYPEVTSNELRLMALLKMNLTSKEIANILNISNEGIKKARYRLRKKLHLSTEDSLQELVFAL